MPSIFQVGFVALTAASTALAHVHAPYGNTTSVYLPTGIIPTGLVPTGIIPTGTGGSSISTIHGPYTNTTISHSSTTTPPPVITTPPPTGQWTTSTIYTTQVETVTSCPPQVTKCPYGSVITKTIAISTTICPVTETPKPTYTVVPFPPKSVTITSVVTDVHTITKPSGEEYITSKIYTTVITCPYTEAYPPHASTPVAPGVSHTVAPYPTGTATFSTIRGTAPIGTATGLPVPTKPYKPDGILTLSVTNQPQPSYTPPPLEQSAAGKIGVSSVLALVLATALALLY